MNALQLKCTDDDSMLTESKNLESLKQQENMSLNKHSAVKTEFENMCTQIEVEKVRYYIHYLYR